MSCSLKQDGDAKIEGGAADLKNRSGASLPMLIQLWRTSQLGIGIVRAGTRLHIVIYRRRPSTNRIISGERVVCRTRTWRARFSVDRALIVARNRFHYRFYVFSDPTSIAATAAAPSRLGIRSFADCLVITTVRRPSAARGQYRPVDLAADDSWRPDRRSLIHIFSARLSSSTTCNTIIHEAAVDVGGQHSVHSRWKKVRYEYVHKYKTIWETAKYSIKF